MITARNREVANDVEPLVKLDPPAPSNALAQAVTGMRPVRTRSPWRAWLATALVLAAYGGLLLRFVMRMRPDLHELPLVWILGVGTAWSLGFLVPLGIAFIPRRGQVLPDGVRALYAAVAAVVALLLVSLVFPAPPSSRSSKIPGLFGHCLQVAMVLAIVPIAASLALIRRLAPVGSWRFGAAIGAAAGALSGALLHLTCGVNSAAHVAVAHGGAVILCALFGALVTPRVAA
jgi:hypothetical protein